MADPMALAKLDNLDEHQFQKPTKRIHDGPDVSFFLTSFAYRDIIVFILQLNHSVLPRKRDVDGSTKIITYPLESPDVTFSFAVQSLRALLTKLIDLVDEIPPDTDPVGLVTSVSENGINRSKTNFRISLANICPRNLNRLMKNWEPT